MWNKRFSEAFDKIYINEHDLNNFLKNLIHNFSNHKNSWWSHYENVAQHNHTDLNKNLLNEEAAYLPISEGVNIFALFNLDDEVKELTGGKYLNNSDYSKMSKELRSQQEILELRMLDVNDKNVLNDVKAFNLKVDNFVKKYQWYNYHWTLITFDSYNEQYCNYAELFSKLYEQNLNFKNWYDLHHHSLIGLEKLIKKEV